MCDEYPPAVCFLCGNDASTTIVTLDKSGESTHLMFCEEHADAVLARTAMMERTAHLN